MANYMDQSLWLTNKKHGVVFISYSSHSFMGGAQHLLASINYTNM
jgi:hypothetical protein